MKTAIEHEIERFRGLYQKVPRGKRAGLFALVENGETPDQIRARADLSPAEKDVVAHAKQQHEESRQFIIADRRQMWNTIYKRMNKPALVDLMNKAGLEVGEKATKADMAERLAQQQVPDTWGRQWSYMPHLFFGDYRLSAKVKGQDVFIGRAINQNQAVLQLMEYRAAHPEAVDFRAEVDPVIPTDVIRMSRGQFGRLRAQLKKAADATGQEISEAMRGVVGLKESKQKWYGALQRRFGYEGFEKDFQWAYEAGVRQFERWRHLTALNKQLQPQLEQLRKVLPAWAEHIEDGLKAMWGRPTALTLAFDETLRKIPLLARYVKPLALARWGRVLSAAQYYGKLTKLSYALINKLQPAQTLAPVIGYARTAEAMAKIHTKAGQAILDKFAPTFASQWSGSSDIKATGLRRFLPQTFSEKGNLATAFIGMYDHGIRLGMSEAEAVRYATLNGIVRTQFYPTVFDTPRLMRNPLGAVLLQFKRFSIKNLGLAASLARDRNYTGLARWLGAQVVLGGANLALKPTTWVVGATLGTSLPLWLAKQKEKLEKEYGSTVANGLLYGLPGLIGADIGGSINAFDVPYGDTVWEKAGRAVLGPTAGDVVAAGETLADQKAPERNVGIRLWRTLAEKNKALAPVDEFLRLVLGEDGTYTNARGQKRYSKPLSVKSRLLRAGGFRSAQESDYSRWVEALREVEALKNAALDRAVVAEMNKDTVGRDAILQQWHQQWPDIPMTPRDVRIRSKTRGKNKEEGVLERVPACASVREAVTGQKPAKGKGSSLRFGSFK